MTKSPNFRGEPCQDDLPTLVAKEVEQILFRYDQVIKERSSIWAGMLPDNVAAAGSLSPIREQAIQDDLSALASEFVRRLAVEAARRFDPSAGAAEPLGGLMEGSRDGVLEPRFQQSECLRIEDWAGQVAGPTYLEQRFGIPRSTLHCWQRRNDVVAFRKGARKHVFPVAQFIDGRPAPGIRQVLSLIANPRQAWLGLSRPSPRLDGRIPIEMLRQDLAPDVISAARDYFLT
ncbi:hypothetical protein NKH67_31760 [Mesorhizobium sp. M0968]